MSGGCTTVFKRVLQERALRQRHRVLPPASNQSAAQRGAQHQAPGAHNLSLVGHLAGGSGGGASGGGCLGLAY